MFASTSLIPLPAAQFAAMNARLQQLGTECAIQTSLIGTLQEQIHEKDTVYQESIENILTLSRKCQALSEEIESLKNERNELTVANAALETKAVEQGCLLAMKARLIDDHRADLIKKQGALIDDMTSEKKVILEQHHARETELNRIIAELSEDKETLQLEIKKSQEETNSMGQQIKRLQAEASHMSYMLTNTTFLLQQTQHAFASYKANAEESERRFIASQVELRNTSLELAATKKKLVEAEAKLAQKQAPSATQSPVSAFAAQPTKMKAVSAGRASSSPKSIMFGPTVLTANPNGSARSLFTPDHR